MVRANIEHPLFSLMRDLIDATYGPVPVIRELLSPIDGVEAAFIYGSWAARRAGAGGEFARDIDVLVIGTASRRALAEAASSASARIGVDVNVSRVTHDEWEATEPTPFLATVKGRPMVELLSGEAYG